MKTITNPITDKLLIILIYLLTVVFVYGSIIFLNTNFQWEYSILIPVLFAVIGTVLILYIEKISTIFVLIVALLSFFIAMLYVDFPQCDETCSSFCPPYLIKACTCIGIKKYYSNTSQCVGVVARRFEPSKEMSNGGNKSIFDYFFKKNQPKIDKPNNYYSENTSKNSIIQEKTSINNTAEDDEISKQKGAPKPESLTEWSEVSKESFWRNEKYFSSPGSYKSPNIKFFIPPGWDFFCCHDMDFVSHHLIFSSMDHDSSLPYIDIIDYGMKGCPQDEQCSLDDIVVISAQEKYNRLTNKIPKNKILPKKAIKNLGINAFVYKDINPQGKAYKGYIMNFGNDVLEIDFYNSNDQEFINEFLSYLRSDK